MEELLVSKVSFSLILSTAFPPGLFIATPDVSRSPGKRSRHSADSHVCSKPLSSPDLIMSQKYEMNKRKLIHTLALKKEIFKICLV